MPKQDQAGDAGIKAELEKALEAKAELERRLEAALVDRDNLTATLLEVSDDPEAKLVAALARAQGEYPRIEKTKTGTVSGVSKSGAAYSYDYSYADLGDVLSAVRPVLSRHGLALVQRTTTDERGKVTLLTELRHVAGGKLDSVVELGQSSGNPQAFGGALTYLRRYEAGTLLGVAPEEDTDARGVQPSDAGGGRQQQAPELPPWATELSRERVRDELGPRLKLILGDEGAREAARVIKANLGQVPAIVSMVAGLVVDTLLEQNPDELVSRLADEQVRRRQAKAEAEAQAERERLELERQQADAAAEAGDPAPPEAEGPTDAEAPPAAPTGPPAGSVKPPELDGLTAAAGEAALREAGCICTKPLEAFLDEKVRNDECPIMGHGIPF